MFLVNLNFLFKYPVQQTETQRLTLRFSSGPRESKEISKTDIDFELVTALCDDY